MLQGACGKRSEIAALQDLLTYELKGLAIVAAEGRKAGVLDREANVFTVEAMFATVTNVNFDLKRIAALVKKCAEIRDKLKKRVNEACVNVSFPAGPADFSPASGIEEMISQGKRHGVKSEGSVNEDIHSLQEILLYGARGVAAYTDHAQLLGKEDDVVFAFLHDALIATHSKDISLEDALSLVLKCGEINLRAMELLDAGHTETYGHPVPTKVPLGPKKGKAILVSGHDLMDLAALLKQTEGTGINVYTHGEMLPAHGYPELKKHSHFHGHFGTAWQNQMLEFAKFPGAILMTTNCIQNPRPSYKGNIFTSGMVGWPEVNHVAEQDFSAVINRALELPGFEVDEDKGSVMVGFARNAVMSVAGTVIDAVKAGKIRHFFLVGGCDGAKPGRDYYTELVEKIPNDCVVLTLACGKFRFFDKDLGDIGGIPRLLDVGQCNDAYSAIRIAAALAEAFNCGINDLPLSMILSWYEQKAVCVLLSLLHLGIKGIRLGPSLPAFITPNVLDVLVKTFDIKLITTPDEDLAAILK
jgi:hydroxylamine reductase